MGRKDLERFKKVFGEIKEISMERVITIQNFGTKPQGRYTKFWLKDTIPEGDGHNPWYSTIDDNLRREISDLCLGKGDQVKVVFELEKGRFQNLKSVEKIIDVNDDIEGPPDEKLDEPETTLIEGEQTQAMLKDIGRAFAMLGKGCIEIAKRFNGSG